MFTSRSPNTSSPPLRASRAVAAVALALAGAQPANAIVFRDEVTLYLTHASYSPGKPVDTTFYFGSKPAVDLSSFDFTLTWDTALATPASTGPGSVADWMAALDRKGSVSYSFTNPTTIQGGWQADPLGGSASFISTSYNQLKWAVFTFETSTALKTPFVISIELTNIRDSAGEFMDLGSGFINWATITPVPEPATWISLACGFAALALPRHSRQR